MPPHKDALRDEDPILLDRDGHGTVLPRVPHTVNDTPGQPPAFWQGTLDGSEAVIWFGAPDPVRAMTSSVPSGIGLYALYGSGVIAGLGLLASQTDTIMLKIVGMVLFVLSGAQISRMLNLGGRRLRYQHYLLTDRAIYIATVRPGNRLRINRCPITAEMVVIPYDDSIQFAVGTRQRKGRPKTPVYVSFQHIQDPAYLHARVSTIQKGMT